LSILGMGGLLGVKRHSAVPIDRIEVLRGVVSGTLTRLGPPA